MKPRVVLADDHALVLEGFRRILEGLCDLVGTAQDGRELLVLAEQVNPDVIFWTLLCRA